NAPARGGAPHAGRRLRLQSFAGPRATRGYAADRDGRARRRGEAARARRAPVAPFSVDLLDAEVLDGDRAVGSVRGRNHDLAFGREDERAAARWDAELELEWSSSICDDRARLGEAAQVQRHGARRGREGLEGRTHAACLAPGIQQPNLP